MSLGQTFLSEFLGTAFLILLGVGVIATNLLAKSRGRGAGRSMINFRQGSAVLIGVYVAYGTGGHLNLTVTLGPWAADKAEFVSGVPANVVTICTYIVAQFLGALVDAVLVWLAYKKHYDEHKNPVEILGTFSIGPEIRSYGQNLVIEAIATFVLMAWVLTSGDTETAVEPLAVALVIAAISASLGGPTGYVINQARNLGPRVAHAILPIKDKGSSDWAYVWALVVEPTIGGILTGLVFGKFGIMNMTLSFPS